MVKVAYIQWEDHSGWDGPMTDKQIAEHGPVLIDSAGIIVSEDEQCIRFVQDRYTTDEPHSRDVAVILKKCITKMKVWEVPDGKGSKKSVRK